VSLYTVPLSAVNGLSRLTKLTTSKGTGTADSIRKISNRPITFESNRIGWPIRVLIELISKLGRSLVINLMNIRYTQTTYKTTPRYIYSMTTSQRNNINKHQLIILSWAPIKYFPGANPPHIYPHLIYPLFNLNFWLSNLTSLKTRLCRPVSADVYSGKA